MRIICVYKSWIGWQTLKGIDEIGLAKTYAYESS